jgi:hypothetical protein
MAVTTYMYLFKCPLCGVSLHRFVTDDQIVADSEIHSICDRAQDPLGCGEKIILKPSQGVVRQSGLRFSN